MFACVFIYVVCIWVCMCMRAHVCVPARWITKAGVVEQCCDPAVCPQPQMWWRGGRGLSGRDPAGFGVPGPQRDTPAPCFLPGFTLTHQGCNSVTRQAEPSPEINMGEMFWHVMFQKKKKVKFAREAVLRIFPRGAESGWVGQIPWRGHAGKHEFYIHMELYIFNVYFWKLPTASVTKYKKKWNFKTVSPSLRHPLSLRSPPRDKCDDSFPVSSAHILRIFKYLHIYSSPLHLLFPALP